jgi:glycosyltransferase involved in cell wall biosynthesis
MTMVTGLFDKGVPRLEQREHFKIIRVGIGHKKIDKILYPILAALAVRKFKPQIAHAIMESYAGMALVLVKYLAPGVKRILTLQSGDLDDIDKQSRWFIKWPWKIIHLSPHIITSISTFLSARAKRIGVPEDRIILTPNGIDLSMVPGDIRKIPGRVCIPSRLAVEKGHKYLLEAWPQVMQSCPNASLVIVNDGPERKNIERMTDELGIKDSVTMVGYKTQPETLIDIAKAEVLVSPSLMEGLGIVFIEAQACGTVPIGTRVGGIPDVIQDGVNGLLIEPKNSEQIASAVIRLLEDKALRERLAENGMESCRKYDWYPVMGKFDDIYHDILK